MLETLLRLTMLQYHQQESTANHPELASWHVSHCFALLTCQFPLRQAHLHPARRLFLFYPFSSSCWHLLRLTHLGRHLKRLAIFCKFLWAWPWARHEYQSLLLFPHKLQQSDQPSGSTKVGEQSLSSSNPPKKSLRHQSPSALSSQTDCQVPTWLRPTKEFWGDAIKLWLCRSSVSVHPKCLLQSLH